MSYQLIDDEEMNNLKKMIAKLFELLKPQTKKWGTGEYVCKEYNMSKRKLQSLRTRGKVNFSRIEGTLHYRIADFEKILDDNYNGKKS